MMNDVNHYHFGLQSIGTKISASVTVATKSFEYL